MSSTGFVNQTYCDMMERCWYTDVNVRSLFEHLLRVVNKSDNVMSGLSIKAGSVLTTIPYLSFTTGLTEKQIRIACQKLISTNDISISAFHKKGSIITIVEWDKYFLGNDVNHNPQNIVKTDKMQNRADIGQIQDVENDDDTNAKNENRADIGQINEEGIEKTTDGADIGADIGQIQDTESQHDENMNNENWADIGADKRPQKEAEREERSPTPSKEDKNSKEKNINININKKEKSLKIVFNFETNAFDNITEQDMAMWHQAYPAIDLQGEIAKAACWLAANPKRKKSNYKQFLNNWFSKAQDRYHPSQPLLQFPQQHEPVPLPTSVDNVMAKIQELNLSIPRDEAEKFFHYYKALGWIKNGRQIYDWTELLHNWANNLSQYGQDNSSSSSSSWEDDIPVIQ